ncbi:MAG: Hsp20/alpha crystallin family protein [Planctomycetota bacterium]
MIRKTHTARDPFQHLVGRLFGDALTEFYGRDDADEVGTPRTNISENATSYELAFELPGIAAEQDIDVQLHDGTLTVTAERPDQRKLDPPTPQQPADGDAPSDDQKPTERKWHRVEHRYGRYSRAISLPKDTAHSGIDAIYEAGVLTVTVPKQPEAQPSRIAVRARSA